MGKIKKANITFTGLILVYIIMIFTIRLVPVKYINYNFLMVLPEAVFLLATLLFSVFMKNHVIEDMEFNMIPSTTVFKTVILSLLLVPSISVINYFSSMVNGNQVTSTIDHLNATNPLWLNVVMMAALPAFVEEFIFRGILFSAYKRNNPFKGVMLSAFLFGLMHMNINQFAYAFVLGIVLALVDYATGSVVTGMVMHFTFNANSVILSYLISKLQNIIGSEELQNTAQLVNDGATTDSVAQIMSMIYGIVFIFSIVGVSLLLAALLFANMCNENRGVKNVLSIFKKEMREYKGTDEKMLDVFLGLGIFLCLGYIIYSDFMI